MEDTKKIEAGGLTCWRFCDTWNGAGGTLRLSYRYLRPEPFNNPQVDFKIRRKIQDVVKDEATLSVLPECENPWVWRADFEITDGGQGMVEVTMTADGKPETESLVVEVPLNQQATVTVDRQSPRLCVALNTTPQRPGQASLPQDGASVATMLEYIWSRLVNGLLNAWMGPDAGRGLRSDLIPAEGSDGLMDEQWARTYTEMLLFAPYETPTTTYQAENDHFWMRQLAEGRCYPLTAECLHLCNLGLFVRGYSTSDLAWAPGGDAWGVNAGGSHGVPIFLKKNGGSWQTDEIWEVPADALAPKPAPPPPTATEGTPPTQTAPVCPGSCYEYWNKENKTNTGAAHIAIVLRTHKPEQGQGSWHGIQLFDTGAVWGLATGRRGGPITVWSNGDAGSYDDPWRVAKFNAKDPFSGVGIPRWPPPALAEGLARARRAFPLGFARLVITRTPGYNPPLNPADILYASPLLRMNTGQEDWNFSPARYLWSLRELPGRSSMGAIWQIFVPRMMLAGRLARAARWTSVADLLQQAHLAEATRPNAPIGPLSLRSLGEIWVTPDGLVHLNPTWTAHTPGPADGLPWGTAAVNVNIQPANIPFYFRGMTADTPQPTEG